MSKESSARSEGVVPPASPVNTTKSRNDTASQFIYEALDAEREEIRLLTLHPSPEDDKTLSCTLSHAALLPDADSPSRIPEYEALSYVWGAPDFSAQIMLNNEEFRITPSLATILSNLRRQDRPRVLWVDALCINQSDLGERARQVALMRKIYSLCQQDIAWLEPETDPNPPAEDTELVLQAKGDKVIQHLEPHERMRMGMEVMRRVTQSDDALQADAEGHKPDTSVMYATIFAEKLEEEALECLFENSSFWNRVWIVQELSCAPDVTLMCKGAELSWSSIATILQDEPILDAYHSNSSHSSGRLEVKMFEMFHKRFGKVKLVQEQRRILSQALSSGGTESTLIDVLARFRGKESTDPRDRIYGLLGLVTQEHGIKVDYTRSVSGLSQETTTALINMMGNLDIICQNPFERRVGQSALQGASQGPEKIPSWAAEFDTNRSQSVSVLFAQRNIFNAGSTNCETPCRLVGPNQEILVLKGTVIGHVGSILQAHLEKQDDSEVARLYLGADSLSFSSTLQYIPTIGGRRVPERKPEDAVHAYYRTLTRDCTAPPGMRRLHEKEIWTLCVKAQSYLENGYAVPTCYAASDRDLYGRTYGFSVGEGEDRRKLEGFIYLNVAGMLHPEEWMFTMADNGLYLLVRPHAQEGDVVVVLDGGKVPMVLRRAEVEKSEGVEDVYHIVGPAYVHGLMDGEVEVAVGEGWLKKQDFFVA
ncbi:hypothetical protein ACJ41O_011929 [Fusarium nematophilum]